MRVRHPVLLVLGAIALGVGAVSVAPALAGTSGSSTVRSCAKATKAKTFACLSEHRRTGVKPNALGPDAAPSGYTPTDLRNAYGLAAAATGAGSGVTVAIVDAFNNPNVESDLAFYRTNYGLSACTTTNGCFKKVNQNGATSPMPPNASGSNLGWAGEIALDVEMVSAICPNCHILLVEANSNSGDDLYAAVDYAAAHAKFVSNSWGGPEYSSETADDAHFNHPGVAITVSTGDDGYGVQYPSASRYVTAVGGTSLVRNSWAQTAWSGAGSGCSAFESKPAWQPAISGCSTRGEADVSAVADPNTGVAVYSTFDVGGWDIFGGTSVAAPIIASVYALAGTPGASDYPASYPYAHTANLTDVTAGSNGSCGTNSPLCNSGVGWDGPTGLGTPVGVNAFAAGTPITITPNTNQTSTVGSAVSLQLSASGGTGAYTWSATGLPAGLSLNTATGLVTGTPTVAGTSSVTVSATSNGRVGAITFTWTVNGTGSGCSPRQILGNPGFETGSASPWTATPAVISSASAGEKPHSGIWYAWLDGYGTTHTDTLSQSVTIPAGCTNVTLSFYLRIDTVESTKTAANDKLTVKVGSTTFATYSNLNKSSYALRTFNVTAAAPAGATVTVTFSATENSSLATSFVLDDTGLAVS